MNRTYRIVWSECRNAFIVAGENAKAKGKPSSTRKAVASAVVMALVAMSTESAMAVVPPSCASLLSGFTIGVTGTAVTSPCNLGPGVSLTVGNTGSIITPGNPAVVVTGNVSAGGITNSNLISGGGYGILLNTISSVGSITNSVSGTISATNIGIGLYHTSTVSGGITNSGTISGTAGAGISLNSNSTVTGGITSSGLISGAVGIYVDGTSAISGGSNGILIHSGGTVTGGINNSGLISGTNYGISLNGSTVDSITNNASSGTISGISGAGIILSASTVSGGITNTGGTISGLYEGIYIFNSTVTGGISNSGLISGTNRYGIQLSNASSVGSITNAGGTISGGLTGIYLYGSTVTSGISNSGTISGTAGAGISLNSNSTVTGGISSSGLISGTVGIYVDGTSAISGGATGILIQSGGTVTGGINNSGLISGTQYGIGIIGSSTTGATVGGITNSGTTGTITGATGIYLKTGTVTGGITNSGTISGTAGAGISLNSNSTVTGGIINSGLISGTTYGIGIVGSSGAASVGNITNSATGTISGATGIYLSHGTVTNGITNSGTISGTAGAGISLNSSSTVTGGITNNGLISGSSYGIYVDGSSTISGGAVGIIIHSGGSVSGGINNSGLISGTNTGIAIKSHSTVSGGITSSGLISGAVGILVDATSTISGATGIRINTGGSVSGGINNSGTISGTSSIGIAAFHGTLDSITNSSTGTIFGLNTGISLNSSSTVTGGITNSGTISGSAYAIYVDASSTLPNIDITGTSARLIGAVVAPNTALNITSGANFTSEGTFDVGSFNIASTGVFNMANGVTVGAGTGLFTNAGTLSVAAGNTSTITGNYTQISSGTYSTFVTNNTTYGKLVVTGTATLPTSAKIYVNVANPGFSFSATSLNNIISAGTISGDGTFATTTNSSLFNFIAVENGNHVDLTIAAASSSGFFNAVTAEDNTPGDGAARELDALIANDPTGPFANLFGRITGGNSAISAAVTQTLPLLTGGVAQATFGALHGVNHIVQARQEESQGLSSGEDFVTNRNAWVKPIGSWANQGDANGASGYKAQTYGLAFGADGELSQISRLGAAFAITHSNVNNNLGLQRAGVDSYQAVLYGSRVLDDKNTEFNWQGDFSTNLNKGNRNIQFANLNAAASYTSNSFHLGAGVGRTLAMNETTSFTPSIRADYTTIHSNGYTETGAGIVNLVVGAQTVNEFIVALDGKVTYKLSDAATLLANLGVGYDTLSKQSSITAAYLGGGAAFTTMGINPSPTIVSGGLGVVVKSSKTVEITGRYDIEARSGFLGQTVSVKARWPF